MSELIVRVRGSATAPLFGARVTGSAGDGFGQLALAWGAMHLGFGPGGMSLVVACKAAPALLVLAGGLLGDRFRRHSVLVAAELLAAATWIGLAACFLTGAAPLSLVCGLALLAGTARAMFMPAERGIIADLVSPERRQTGNARLHQSISIGLLLGLATSGAVIAAVGPGWAAAVKAASGLISAGLLSRLRTPVWQQHRPGVLRELRTGWREFIAHRWVWCLTMQFTAVLLAVAAFMAVIGPLYAEHGHGGAGVWGIVAASEASGAVLGALIAARWRPARPIVIAAVLPATAAAPMFLLAVGVPMPVLVLTMLLPGVCQSIYAVLWATALQRTFAPRVLARVISWTVLGGFALTPAAVFAAGPLTTAIGIGRTAAAAAVLVIAATLLVLLSSQVRRADRINHPNLPGQAKPITTVLADR